KVRPETHELGYERVAREWINRLEVLLVRSLPCHQGQSFLEPLDERIGLLRRVPFELEVFADEIKTLPYGITRRPADDDEIGKPVAARGGHRCDPSTLARRPGADPLGIDVLAAAQCLDRCQHFVRTQVQVG